LKWFVILNEKGYLTAEPESAEETEEEKQEE